jgi:hypothetical protein
MRRLVERVSQLVLRWPVLASFVAYCAIAAVLGRHVLANLSATVVHDAGDPLLTSALLHWNAWVLPFTKAWWQFPIFHPTQDALAFSEHLLGLSVVATPIEWMLRDPLAAANVTTLLTYPLCGVAMLLLVRHLTGSLPAAFLAGLAFAFAPYRAAQMPHVQMLAVFWAPLALFGLHAYLDSGRKWWLAVYGGAWLLQALSNLYSLYFLSALVALWGLWFVIAPRRWAALRDIAVTTLVAAIPLAPTLGTYVTVHARHGFERTAFEAQVFSADLTSLFCAPSETALWGSWLRVGCNPEAAIFPGAVLLALVAVAIVSLRRRVPAAASAHLVRLARILAAVVALLAAAALLAVAVAGPWRIDLGVVRASASDVDKPLLVLLGAGIVAMLLSPTLVTAVRQRSIAGFYLLAAFGMWLLALGPTVEFLGVSRVVPGPFQLLLLVPGGSGMRAPARFWIMATLCLAVVAGFAAGELLARRSRRATGWLVALLAVGLLTDGWATIPPARAPQAFPDPVGLRGQTVLQLPIGAAHDFAPQYLAVTGGWRSINGYSGYEPRFYEALKQGARFEVDGLFQPFRARGDLYVVVSADQPRLRALVERQPGVVAVGDRDGLLQYRLPRQRTAASRQARTAPLRIAAASSSCPEARAAIDGQLETRWVCGPQTGREWFQADLGAPVDGVSAVRYMLGESYREFPRALVVETSIDGKAWQPAWKGDVIAPTIEGSLVDPLHAPTTLTFAPRRARFIRMRQTGKDADVSWALPELAILGRGDDQFAKAY